MKFLGMSILVVAAIVLALLLLREHQAKSPGPAAAVAPAPAVQQPVYQPSAVAGSSALVEAVWTMAPPQAAAQAQPIQQPQAAQAPADDRQAAFERVAQKVGARLVAYQPGGGSAEATIQWASNSAGPGGDFLDQCITEGLIRDFDDMGSTRGNDRQGRLIWTAKYRLKW